MANKTSKEDRNILPQDVPPAQATIHYLETGQLDKAREHSTLSEEQLKRLFEHHGYVYQSNDQSNTSQ